MVARCALIARFCGLYWRGIAEEIEVRHERSSSYTCQKVRVMPPGAQRNASLSLRSWALEVEAAAGIARSLATSRVRSCRSTCACAQAQERVP